MTLRIRNAFGWLGACLLIWSAASVSADPSEAARPLGIPYPISVENEANGSVSFRDHAVEITAKKGTDLFTDTQGKTHANNTPRVLFQPAGDFVFSAKVAASLGAPYDGGALIVYADDHHWAKLLFERFQSGKIGVATTVTSATGDDAYHGTRAAEHQYLKIARRGDSYVFYSSENGAEWNFLRHFSLKADTLVKVGFSAQAPTSNGLTVTFSDVVYRGSTFEDFWQGE